MPPPSQYKNQHQCDHCIACSCSHLCWTSGSFSISSPNTPPDRGCTSISSVAHAMVQERLDQMINERKEARRRTRRRDEASKFVVIVAMEKASDDPRQDFRESIVEVIERNRIMRPRDLRRLLECYLSVNADEYRGDILDVFHKVCTDIFL
ncbi:hypothetical protein QQ045_007472 [Rhodiola kirilowii]